MTKRAVVIGTGAGGLTAAVGLAQAGFEVVALEREKQLGGFLNPFKRKKFHFDPGVHYVGQCDPGGDMYRVLERCGLDPAAIMAPMDPECFDLLRFPDFEVKVPQGVDRYRANLLELFPEDQSDLDRYFAVVRAMLPLMRSDTSGARKLMNVPRIARLALETYGQYLDRTFENPRLRSVLGAQCGDYGLPRARRRRCSESGSWRTTSTAAAGFLAEAAVACAMVWSMRGASSASPTSDAPRWRGSTPRAVGSAGSP